MKVMINCTNNLVTANTTCELDISTDFQKEPIDELHDRVISSVIQSQRPSDSGNVLYCPDIQCDKNVTPNILQPVFRFRHCFDNYRFSCCWYIDFGFFACLCILDAQILYFDENANANTTSKCQ